MYGFRKKRCFSSAPKVRYLVKKVKETGVLIDKPKREKSKTVRTPENIAAVAEVCVKRHQHQFTVVPTLEHFGDVLRRILHKDLDMTPYKVQLVFTSLRGHLAVKGHFSSNRNYYFKARRAL